MPPLLWAIGASIVVSLISFAGIVIFLLKKTALDKILIPLVSFSAGTLIGAAFLHLLPEAAETSNVKTAAIFAVCGFMVFFLLEKYFFWHHCRNGKCDIHPFSYLNLIGDGIHNFTDGLVMGASFVVDIRLGIITTVAIITHEIPQEIGDFGVLVYGGFSRSRALFVNFLWGMTAVLGAGIGVYFSDALGRFSAVILSITAGGFVYIAAWDLIPELYKQPEIRKRILSAILFIAGCVFMAAVKISEGR
jgi:zinc and cadmium transporter